MLGDDRVNGARNRGEVRIALIVVRRAGLDDRRNLGLGRRNGLIECLAGLVFLITLLQRHQLFQNFNIRPAGDRMIEHIHGRHCAALGRKVFDRLQVTHLERSIRISDRSCLVVSWVSILCSDLRLRWRFLSPAMSSFSSRRLRWQNRIVRFTDASSLARQ